MKLSVGGKKFGEVPDESVKPVGHKSLDIAFVEEQIITAVERLIRRYLHRPEARDKWLKALGVQEEKDERQAKRQDSAGTGSASSKDAKSRGKPSSPKRAVHRRPPKDYGDREL